MNTYNKLLQVVLSVAGEKTVFPIDVKIGDEFDSLDLLALLIRIEKEFNIHLDDTFDQTIHNYTLPELVDYVDTLLKGTSYET
jgi:acyl carrier protein